MERDDVMREVRTVCARVMCVPSDRVVPRALLVEDLGADSLDLTELRVAVHDVFGVLADPVELETVVTVEDVADLVLRLRDGALAGGARR